MVCLFEFSPFPPNRTLGNISRLSNFIPAGLDPNQTDRDILDQDLTSVRKQLLNAVASTILSHVHVQSCSGEVEEQLGSRSEEVCNQQLHPNT